jgi:23S rRNA G2445 N2-methylase RlmL
MRIIAVCPVACEHAACSELGSLGCSNLETGLGWCRADTDDVWRILRYTQTVSHVLLEAGVSDPVELNDQAAELFASADSFRVTAITGSREQERRIGEVLFERYTIPVDLDDPAIEVGVVDGSLGFVLSGFDYSLREYKVYKTPRSLNPCVAASILWGLDIPLGGVFCDPLCHDGVLPIEFSLRALGMSPRRFQERTLASRLASRFDDRGTVREPVTAEVLALDQNANYLRRAEHNARLAGVSASIAFSRYDLEWIDMRLGEGGVDRCVLELPHRSARLDASAYDKVLADVRFAADHMLAPDGALIAISNDPLVRFDGFELEKRLVVPRGELVLYALAFGRER